MGDQSNRVESTNMLGHSEQECTSESATISDRREERRVNWSYSVLCRMLLTFRFQKRHAGESVINRTRYK